MRNIDNIKMGWNFYDIYQNESRKNPLIWVYTFYAVTRRHTASYAMWRRIGLYFNAVLRHVTAYRFIL